MCGCFDGADEGNRTPVCSLEGCRSSIELHPQRGDSEETRTPDPLIKSQLLYHLSYRVMVVNGLECCPVYIDITRMFISNRWWRRVVSNHRTQWDLIYSQTRLASSLRLHLWCRLEESNLQPTDYKSVALPIELSRHSMVEVNGLEPLTLCL